ncbi:DUF1559 family PulG-like putative transporter [Tuwongella immobilis]|uniref:DUF1559 domain-containing protein n=1 Tax=Tuwongella immobilis TaxID=692036 RepID=A0A6C2YVV7_9BACT|nr:DUF1559 domain-containing protein [Tuwongella immobilis]VIP05119.1 Uncharacterized protein OS=Singulisphaera acidiphila (strain ATCC BAA-1392 / DSM 18658 / VKM B-2454 / MOB10) GN=Sinac_0610 PE=4 SV=1: SBP_bac_10 [Tuwongella immobilis]VTS07594.1 Uncharacterized protein OS=Singulisphaera acidiphila (strain ATCC BAA-1392 / DSM 18658 / VKM B-2454 / MOB10) GN=Sinac_0610 PE=4 SV=1: SBP_bac_10 [Tuwongella immobilis]
MNGNSSKKPILRLWRIAFSVLIVGALCSIVAWVVTNRIRSNQAAHALKCHGNFCCLEVAMRNYHQQHGHFPPAYLADKDGKPAHSWRVLLLEILEPQVFDAYRFDEPWDGPNNRLLANRMPTCYACSEDDRKQFLTNYFVVMGPDTVFPYAKTTSRDDIKRPREDTILLVEVAGQGIHWMQPSDLDVNTMSFELNDPQRPRISSTHDAGPGVYTVDGMMLRLTNETPDQLREMLRITPEVK